MTKVVEDVYSDAERRTKDAWDESMDSLRDELGLSGPDEDAAAAAAQQAHDEQLAELEAERVEREEEIQKEMDKRNADRERVLSRGRGYGGTVLTQGLDSSTLNIKKKKLGVGG